MRIRLIGALAALGTLSAAGVWVWSTRPSRSRSYRSSRTCLGGAGAMNLALRDIRHNLGRFLLTCVGLSLLLSVALAMIGIYGGVVDEALSLARGLKADLWVVEGGTRGPFAEASRIPGDAREAVARLLAVTAAGSVTFQTVEDPDIRQRCGLAVGYCSPRCSPSSRSITGRRRHFPRGRPGAGGFGV